MIQQLLVNYAIQDISQLNSEAAAKNVNLELIVTVQEPHASLALLQPRFHWKELDRRLNARQNVERLERV